MAAEDDFASMMEGGGPAVLRRLAVGEVVSGPVVHVGADSVYVDLGTRADARIPRGELLGRDGTLRVSVGDRVDATVVDPEAPDGPLLAVSLGVDRSVDKETLELALRSGTPVRGRFGKVLKGGLEVELGGARAFCPASQVERGYAADLTAYVGQEVDVAVLEIKNDGRSIVVSRRRALELRAQANAARALERIAVGDELTGTVASVQTYGAFVDLDGVQGLVHVSEVSHGRVERMDDVMSAGETVRVKVLAIEDGDKGARIRLSMKALQQQDDAQLPKQGEVLTAKVLRLLPHGLAVGTPKGEGVVPKRELTLAPGADHRRAFQVGQVIEVVLLDGAGDRQHFSQARVAEVRAGQDFEEYRGRQQAGQAMGSLGALLSNVNRSGLPAGPPPEPPAETAAAMSPPERPAAQMPDSDAGPAEARPKKTDTSTAEPTAKRPAEPPTGSPPPRRRRIVGPRER